MNYTDALISEYDSGLNEDKNQKQTIIAYHGSNKKFDKFDLSYLGSSNDYGTLGKGIYFTLNKALAKHYAKNGYVYTCEITLNNPLVIDNKQKEKELTDATYKGFNELCTKLNLDTKKDYTYEDKRVIKMLQDNMNSYLKDYDGVIAYWSRIPEIVLDNDEVCVFDPSTIKIKNIETVNNGLNEAMDEDYKTKWDAAKTLNKLNKDTLEQLVDWYIDLYKALLKSNAYKRSNGKPYKSYFLMPTDVKQKFVNGLVSSLKAIAKHYQVIVDEEDIKALCRLLLTKEKYLDNVKDVKIKINDTSTNDIVDDDIFENFDK